MRRKYGFTLIELLVVMVIIAVLAGLLMPAIRKSRSKALVDKAQAEMAALSSVVMMAKLDCGFYVRLCDLSSPDTTIKVLNLSTSVWVDPDPAPGDLFYVSNWDGPYQVFQDRGILNGYGSIPSLGTTSWDVTAVTGDFPVGTPLDPWGRAYGLSYSSGAEKVMVLYSAGPNGRMETEEGAIAIPADSDDIIYKFR